MWAIWMMGCVKTPVNRVTPEPIVEVEQETIQEMEAVPTLVAANGQYETIPLEKDVVRLAVVQSDAARIKEGDVPTDVIGQNLEHMMEMGTSACEGDEKPDIILYHEFPLTGYISGERDEKLTQTIGVPGRETERLAELATSCDAYVVFGAYAHHPDWPKHILSLTTVINRQGEVVDSIWKPRNIKRFYKEFEITTTTVEGVQDAFRKEYGLAAELPVLKTEFGNLAFSTVQLDPLIFAAYAMQGAEIMLRTATYFFEEDVVATSMYNNFYSAMSNIPGKAPYGGNSIVVDPNGKIMGQLSHTEEGVLQIDIPIAEFREERRLPQYSVALTKSVFDQYQEEIPANHLDMPAEELPKDGRVMKELLDSVSRW